MYDQYVDAALPWLLRAPAHTFTTEAVAILMGSLTFDPQWYIQLLGTQKDKARSPAASALREDQTKKLIFTRRCLTMNHCERLFPAYYHNYELGHLMAAKLRKRLEDEASGVVGQPAAGRWLIDRVFSPGASLDWRGLIEQATGEALNPRNFIVTFD